MMLILAIIIILLFVIFMKNKSYEHFADPYSLELHADAINRMKRWNMYGSSKYGGVNGVLYYPMEYPCYYNMYDNRTSS